MRKLWTGGCKPFFTSVQIGSDTMREIEDFELSRYACYLIVQNGDLSKFVIANGQTYFAIQTRRQALQDDEKFKSLKEDKKRLFLRNEMKQHNKQLIKTASRVGVKTKLDFSLQPGGYYQVSKQIDINTEIIQHIE